MNNWKKSKGYADGGAIGSEEMPGIRIGPNSNISDDTRSRAMAMAERLNKGKDVEAPAARRASPKPSSGVRDTGDEAGRLAARKPAQMDTGDESGRLAARKPAPVSRSSAPESRVDNSVPTPANRAKDPKPTGRSRLADDAMDNASKAFQATVVGGAALRGAQMLGRGLRSGAANVAKEYDRVRGAQRARTAAANRSVKRDADDARFADEGNPNYARGGMIKGKK